MELQARPREPRNPQLLKAIRDGKKQEMIDLLDAVATSEELNDYDGNGFNALHYAVKFNRLSVMDTLCVKGANLDLKTDNQAQQTPLHLAAKHNAVEMIEKLIKKGADGEIQNAVYNTPLLTAVVYGQKRAMDKLISLGCATDVRGRDGRSAVFTAAEENQSELLRDFLTDASLKQTFHDLLDVCDSSKNTPLHIACAKGNGACVKALLDSGVILDSRNEENRTPLHLAAENGHVLVVKELLRYGRLSSVDLIEDEDSKFYTPLHLACINGHYNVARVLLEAKADPDVKNARQLTPLDFAATGGYENIVQLLIEYEAKIDSKDKRNWTPLMKACKNGHEKVADILIHKGASVSNKDRNGCNVLDIAIDEGHTDVAMVIAKSSQIENALRNTTKDDDNNETTPMRKLIMKMPDVTEEVFKYCLDREKNEDGIVMEKYKYEFLDDFSFPESGQEYKEIGGDESWRPKVYKTSNHCLQLLANSDKSSRLLKHPLVTSLLEYKWRKYGLWINLAFLFVYLVFIIFLTAFALKALPPETPACVEVRNGNSSSEICKQDASESRLLFVAIAGGIVIFFSIIGLIVEIVQMIHLRLEYFKDWFNYLEIILFTFSIIFVFVFTTNCFCPTPWQWQIGALSLFLGWIDLVKYMKKLPFVGVYPFVFLNISYDFLKMAFLALLLILSFAFSFYMLFYDPNLLANKIRIHTPFDDPWRTIVKTMTMTTGEFEFDSTFRQGGDDDRDIQYPFASYLLWILFIVMMPILLTNLLVGLAVDAYTKGIQEDAVLRNLVLKINLILSVEEFLPQSVCRKLYKSRREIKHENFLCWKKLEIKRSAYDQFEEAYKVDACKKTESEELSDKVNKMDSQLESLSDQHAKLMKMIESVSATLGMLERRFGERAEPENADP